MKIKEWLNWLKDCYKIDRFTTLMHIFRVAWPFLLVAGLLGGAVVLR